MSDEALVKYVEADGLICPFCGSARLECPEKFETDGYGIATRLVHCLSCAKEWDDLYVLTGFQERRNEDHEAANKEGEP